MAAHVQIRPVEEAFLRNWPSLETIVDGDWVWRFARGYTGRANSLMCLDPADNHDVASRLATHFKRSLKYKIIPRVRVTPLMAPEIIELLDQDGWSKQGDIKVMLKSLDAPILPRPAQERFLLEVDTGYPSRETRPNKDFEPGFVETKTEMALSKPAMLDPGSGQWLGVVVELLGLESSSAAIYAEMMQRLPPLAKGIVIAKENGVPACAMLVTVFNHVGNAFGLTTTPALRRRGLGRKLMGQGLDWMKNNGASCVGLQVVADNKKALSLYHSLGFEIAYSYHYRILPENA